MEDLILKKIEKMEEEISRLQEKVRLLELQNRPLQP